MEGDGVGLLCFVGVLEIDVDVEATSGIFGQRVGKGFVGFAEGCWGWILERFAIFVFFSVHLLVRGRLFHKMIARKEELTRTAAQGFPSLLGEMYIRRRRDPL